MLAQSAATYLLFPSAEAVNVEEFAQQERHRLIVPTRPAAGTNLCDCGLAAGHAFCVLLAVDGTWSTAGSIIFHNPHLLSNASQVLKIGSHEPSVYGRLKEEPHPHCISTAEAVGHAVAHLLGSAEGAQIPPLIKIPLTRLVEIQLNYSQPRKAKARS
eukprot:m.722704 g.722704  ORF g.722704 m.722704 type:complete len:158 (+) comp58825_c1_seq22:3022-3495(+)